MKDKFDKKNTAVRRFSRLSHLFNCQRPETCRRQHVGEDLYRHVLAFAREKGFYNVTLNVWSCNPGARLFYEKMGMIPYKTCMETIL